MKNVFIIFGLVFSLNVSSFAQSENQKEKILLDTEVSVLQKLSSELSLSSNKNKNIADSLAVINNWPIRIEREEGKTFELKELKNNRPLYFTTHNLNAAKSVSTNKVWPGGSAGLNLNGSGLIVGEWDGGKVRNTHQELNGRVTQVDGASSLSDHSTHVAGTMIASGIQSNAKGMAFLSALNSYEWNNDAAEMSSAAANGLLFSNHSYGYITGWEYDFFGDGLWVWFGDPSVSQTIDYRFGYYSDISADRDLIAFNAPYYLIVKSAGNDRNDSGPLPGQQHWFYNSGWTLSSAVRNTDGNYDCIGDDGVGKNILTVGAVNDIPNGYTSTSDVTMSSFSSWGPVDDGRIKPDIVANGVSLYSSLASSNSTYGSYSGTSMAAPNVTGSLALLQQHFQNTHGAFMLAATLKALIIHSADEAGVNQGPDYQFGWGLLNTKKAVDIITADASDQNIIREANLANGQSFIFDFYNNGQDPLIGTVVWQDPPASPFSPQLNTRTPRLVNDLDLRIVNLDLNETHFPWKLNADSPSAAAVKTDNNLDNVERVNINNPVAGNYRVTVTHKGNLQNNSQNFSLILTGINSIPSDTSSPVITAALPDTSVAENQLLAFTYSAFDPDAGQVVTFALINPPAGASINSVTGQFQWQPGFDQEGQHTITVRVFDNGSPVRFTETDAVVNVNNTNRAPSFISILPDTGIAAAQFLAFNFSGSDPDADQYSFSIASFLPAPVHMPQITSGGSFSWQSDLSEAGISFTAVVEISDGNLSSYSSSLIAVNANLISGSVSYFGSGIKIPNAVINFTSGVISTDAVSDADGNYQVSLGNGTYAISTHKTDLTSWSSPHISIADAFRAAQNGASSITLSGLPLMAGNVNNSGNGAVNASDALLIAFRSIQHVNGIFLIPTWLFDSPGDITVNGQDQTSVNLTGILAGDINANATGVFNKVNESRINVRFVQEEIGDNTAFKIPVRIADDADLGAFKFELKFNAADVVLDSIKGFSGDLLINVNGSDISIAWLDLSGGKVKKIFRQNSDLLELFFTRITSPSAGGEFSLNINTSSEFLNSAGEHLSDITLETVSVKYVPLSSFALNQNYPNPFNPVTRISYTIPRSEFVSLRIYDLLGREIKTLVNAPHAEGKYEAELDAGDIPSGIYIYTLQAGSYKHSKKLILLK